MKALRSFLDFFLYSNIFISLCAAAFTAQTYLLIHSEINLLYVAFVFTATLSLYNFPALIENNFLPEQSERHKWIFANKKPLILFFAMAFAATLIFVFFFSLKFFLWLVPTALIAFAYFFPQTHLRSITGLKTGIVAFVWVSITAFFPFALICNFDPARIFNYENKVILLQDFFFIFPLCVIYNVRDIEADRKAGVKTFPVIYGVKTTILICILSLIAFSVFVLFSFFAMQIKIAFLCSAVLSAAFMLFASESRSEYFYSFWIDGMILLQAVLVAAIAM